MAQLLANDPKRSSWIPVSNQSDFPIQNLPFGVFIADDDIITTGTRIGNTVIDLSVLQQLDYFNGIDLPDDVFLQDNLNDFIALGRPTWRAVRNRLAELFDENNETLKSNTHHQKKALFLIEQVQMLMPVFVSDYTDFYSSIEHATNVGKMFRDPDNALLPNWKHIPVGYHGRSSSIVISGVDLHRPKGQRMAPGADAPTFGPSVRMDFELEMAFITGEGKALGHRIKAEEADEYIFGMVVFNDWSARDIQKWEYVPLGPFLGKSFGSSMSPWIVTMDALEPYKVAGPLQDVKVLPYLETTGENNYDIKLEVELTPEGKSGTVISRSNYKYMYWNQRQQLAHHTVNGCNINAGDMMASGTISGPTKDSYGSMLELSWSGKEPITLDTGDTRTFIEDNDRVTMRGWCDNGSIRIGFGEVSTTVLPAIQD